jgi:hypothetical protein
VNGVDKKLFDPYYDNIYAYSGGTRTALTALEYYPSFRCNTLILISPMQGVSLNDYSQELRNILNWGKAREIIIYKSDSDYILGNSPIGKFLSTMLGQVKSYGNLPSSVNPQYISLYVDPATLTETAIQIDNQIDMMNHVQLFYYIYDHIRDITHYHPEPPRRNGDDDSSDTPIVSAKDPNNKFGPDGYVSAGQKLDYKIEFENVGEGSAYGVYFTDVLDNDLNASTLEIGSVISTANGSTLSGPGIYDPLTRTITWFVNEVGPGEGGCANYSAKVNVNVFDGTEIINYATVYFPSVPETTPTNAIISVVGKPNIAITNVNSSESTIEKGTTQAINIDIANNGYFGETFNVTLYANTTIVSTQNYTIPGKNKENMIFNWDTTNFGVGTYNLTAYVYPIQGEVETNDNSYSYGYIQILPTNNSLIDVTIASIPSGKSFVKVDGVTVTTPTTFDWLPGSQHTIEALSSIQVGNGVQCVWTNWSDGGLQSHSFMVSNSSVVATANYQTQYQVLFSSSSQGKGTVTPNTATYYNAGSTISIFANPSSDYSFTGWLSSTPSISFVNSFASSTIATINDPGTITASSQPHLFQQYPLDPQLHPLLLLNQPQQKQPSPFLQQLPNQQQSQHKYPHKYHRHHPSLNHFQQTRFS